MTVDELLLELQVKSKLGYGNNPVFYRDDGREFSASIDRIENSEYTFIYLKSGMGVEDDI